MESAKARIVSATTHNIILRFSSSWKRNLVVAGLVIVIGFVSIFGSLFFKMNINLTWLILPFCLGLGTYFLIARPWNINQLEVTRYLNTNFSDFQESAHLLIKPPHTLSRLELIQVERILSLIDLRQLGNQSNKPVYRALKLFLLGLACASIILAVPARYFHLQAKINASKSEKADIRQRHEALRPALIQEAKVLIEPPAYTGKLKRAQESLQIKAEEGSIISWTLRTSGPVRELRFVLNDSLTLSFQRSDKDSTLWSLTRKISSAGFYQLQINDTRSDLYTLEVVNDYPPVIHIENPEPYTKIEFGSPHQLNVSATINDDYGMAKTALVATIASGSGEGVKFTEQHLPFGGSTAGAKIVKGMKLFDLKKMGMNPGDELYFYLTATDNRNQETKSDVYIVSLPDTTHLMELEGLTVGVNLVPEYFRSQRQIIIETEALIRQKDTVTAGAFKAKSNDLANDQKMLRLRYGKFLGEEADEEIAGGREDHDDHPAKDREPVFGDASALLDAYTHKHDNAEDATFFDPKIKEQLKATLAEMWKAELQLRLYKPQQALPFEYKALVLLKDLQQKSRVYVAKTSFTSTPLDPAKRLSGDLSDVIAPDTKIAVENNDNAANVLRISLSSLGLLNEQMPLSLEEISSINIAVRKLFSEAALNPARYLRGAAALKRVQDLLSIPTLISKKDLDVAGGALYELIIEPKLLPSSNSLPGSSLSSYYFKKLNQAK